MARNVNTARHTALVAAGIFLSRIAGLVRQRVFAHYFGQSDPGDAFNAAFKIPNLLQNLFGEGVLSASFIPVYSSLLARGMETEARRVAGVVASLLALVTTVVVAAGVFATPYLVDWIAPGFEAEKRALTIVLVRIIFPGTGLLVLSAWCLGILNSHRRFFLSYTAPVLWSAVMIAAMAWYGASVELPQLAVVLAWASVAGSAMQLAIQLPFVWRHTRGMRPSLSMDSPDAASVVRNFVPVFVGRGVVQISSYIDSILASFLPTGAVTALANAQTLYTLPVSLFGMAVSAAELPAMSSMVGEKHEVAQYLRGRLSTGLVRIAFFIIPSAVAFAAFGDLIAAAFYQTGRFGRGDALWVWGTLAGSSVGLLAVTFARLYASAFYALRDTRTPLRYAIVHVVVATALGYAFALPLPAALGLDARWGTAGLTLSAGLAGWAELVLLRRALAARIGETGLATPVALRLWWAALVGTALGSATRVLLPDGLHPALAALIVLAPYAAGYLAVTWASGVAEARTLITTLLRRARLARPA
ncbi:MAG TPA: murein biosynthesis integral membrane protein MurJ [Candidatus Limnocylindrales bacterium]|nr:murein biosynthesis integral membrane protein MurJ [Candidatus Limnocylindrales bacterium]